MDTADAKVSRRSPQLRLTVSLIRTPLTKQVLTGEVGFADVAVSAVEAKSVDANSRLMLNGGFDIGEMSLATYVKAREEGMPLLGLPIFTGRRFLQPCIACSAGSGIESPADLKGKRVGLPQFWMTSSVWHRGLLHQQHEVRQEEVIWYTATDERLGGMTTPPGVQVHRLAAGRTLEDMLLAGELDATMTPRPSDELAQRSNRVMQPYQDVVKAQEEYFRSTGVFPIMHFVVMREELDREHSWLAQNLCEGFEQAKRAAIESNLDKLPPIVGSSGSVTLDLFGTDPWPYGLEHNRRALETFLEFAQAQGLTSRRMEPKELFSPSSLRALS